MLEPMVAGLVGVLLYIAVYYRGYSDGVKAERESQNRTYPRSG
jgi:hypothetical protein